MLEGTLSMGSEMMDEELITNLRNLLGLNRYEALLYLALLDGASSPKEASMKSGVPYPRVYDTADSLYRRGLVVKRGSWYTPIPPETALGTFADSIVGEALERSQKIRMLGKALSSKYMVETGVRQSFRVIRGLGDVISYSITLLSSGGDAVFTLWKAAEKLDLLFPMVRIFSDILSKTSITIVLPKNIELSLEQRRFLEKIGATICYTECYTLDSLIIDDKVVIGVPNPWKRNDAIAVYIREKELADALRKNVLKKSLCKKSVAGGERSD
jgi:sugar-specific transcriptional regulator TrmB